MFAPLRRDRPIKSAIAPTSRFVVTTLWVNYAVYQILAIIFQWAHQLTEWLSPVLGPLCFVFAWGLIAMVGWSIWSALRDSVQRAKTMHQIPCANCRFFTQDYHLKCPVQPMLALSERAIDCPDYEPDPAQTSSYIAS
jgi:hypothetical protein